MHFTVFGKKIEVKKVSKLMETRSATGVYNLREKSITVDSRLKGDELMHTYMHELIHAMVDRIGLHNCDLSHDLEEILADNILEMLLENFDIRCKKKKVNTLKSQSHI